MKNPILTRGSKFHVDIERLQLALEDLGYSVDIDAQFGPGLQKAVCRLQEAEGLPVDGVVGEQTWEVLAKKSVHGRTLEVDTSLLKNFRGDLHWIHQWEGHAGSPYWPGGASGITLDPGLDLGHASPDLVEGACSEWLDADQMAAVRKVLGKRGEEARLALEEESGLAGIRVLRTAATRMFPFVAKPYWEQLCRRFPALDSPKVPGAVQTALLSLGYNRGASNRGLEPLAEPLAQGNWGAVADVIGAMQQDHQLKGIRHRRQAEARLIRTSATA